MLSAQSTVPVRRPRDTSPSLPAASVWSVDGDDQRRPEPHPSIDDPAAVAVATLVGSLLSRHADARHTDARHADARCDAGDPSDAETGDGPAPLATPVMVGIDGRSGSGKTALAQRVAAMLPGAGVLALEDCYRGWQGLREGLEHAAVAVLEPLREGRPGRYHRWDWNLGALAEQVTVPVARVLLVEGCGAAAARLAPLLDATVWLRAPEPVRRRRAMARDDGEWGHLWEVWAAQEESLLAERDAEELTDLVIDTG